MKQKSTKQTSITSDGATPSQEVDNHPEVFLNRLKNHEAGSIQQLAKVISSFLVSRQLNKILSNEDLEEIVSDAVFITIQKIQSGQFNLERVLPSTYAIAVAKNLVGNRMQKQKLPTTDLEKTSDYLGAELDPEYFVLQKEKEELLGMLLDKLEEPCRQLILLRYYEKITDDEAILQKLTGYSNAKSLKVQRCKCLKKLAVILNKHKSFFLER